MNSQQKNLLDKVWGSHIVYQEPDSPTILYIDLHLIHEVTSPQAFDELRTRSIKVHRPDKTFATIDHSLPTLTSPEAPGNRLFLADHLARKQIETLRQNCEEFGINLFDVGDEEQGIVHVIGPELGLTQPGMTIVCGDSHTATHGAFGSLAFGIGTSEVGYVLGTQCLLQHKPKSFKISINGRITAGVTAKDIILSIIQKIGVDGGAGHVFEYTGNTIHQLDMDARMTICNMSIEAGARAGMIAPDETTFNYLSGKPFTPQGAEWEKSIQKWQALKNDENALYDREVQIDISRLEPMISYGTNPAMSIPISGRIPQTDEIIKSNQKDNIEKALAYMGFNPGEKLKGKKIDVVFIGSCTNSRLSDLREAARIFKDRKISSTVHVLIVPGSQNIKKQAELEGLDKIFKQAGAEWREPGCSMCIAMNGDRLSPGQIALSTSNRNFEGRQGKLGKTLLVSPLTAAASAIMGEITDPRSLIDWEG